VTPTIRTPYVIISYKNFPVAHAVSHIGLGVSALNTSKSLKAAGITTDVWAILNCQTIADKIKTSPIRPTHVIISAPWLPTLDLQNLVFSHSDIQFVVVCHSNVGFLQADPQAITNFRQDLDLEQGALNFTAAGNSNRLCDWVNASYGRPCTYLPNLYFMGDQKLTYRRPWSGGPLRIGSFGAIRPLKNNLSAAAAALSIANDFNVPVYFYLNVSRVEGTSTVIRSIESMLKGAPNITLVKEDWHHWPTFRQLIRSMQILIQPSYTESFNMVTADGAAECVPSVVSDAIEWAPDYWKAEVDDVLSITRIAEQLLHNMHSGVEGFQALQAYNSKGLVAWKKFINSTL
jgi:hypothetical protein